jgi:serine/threonine protein kinase
LNVGVAGGGNTQLPVGTTLQSGKYRIEKVLGQGGFGITYLAEHTVLDRKVAIKEFFFRDYCERNSNSGHVTMGTAATSSLTERFMQKFIKEAKTISRLDHPNIVHIQDVFMENGTAYYVMDYISGKSLEDVVNKDGALSAACAVDYITQVADALKYLHQQNLCHLDVKPANIMADADGHVTLIDFGLSKQYDVQGGQTSTTPVGISHGYAPLEQYNAGGVSEFSPQTDIYSLGATLYKLVTGKTPPQASDIINEGMPDLNENVPDAIKYAIERAMQIKKKDRPNTIDEFVELISSTCDYRKAVGTQQVNSSNEGVSLSQMTSNNSNVRDGKKYIWPCICVCAAIVLLSIFVSKRNSEDSESDFNQDTISLDDYEVEEVAVAESLPDEGSYDSFETKSLKENDLSINIQWPTSLIGVKDIEHLQRLISKRIFDVESTNIDYLISNYKKQYDPSRTEELTFSMEQKINNIIIFKFYVFSDNNGGTGAGVYYNTCYLYYDTEYECFLNIDKVIVNKNRTIDAINKYISLDEYSRKTDFIPDNFILSMDGLTFVFPKYSIGCGAQGEVKIKVPFEDLAGCLSSSFLRAIGRE